MTFGNSQNCLVRSPSFVGVVPMAALLGPLAGIDFGGWCVSAYQVSRTASMSALTYLAALPKDCKLASLHAAMVCSWEEPAYYSIPGFGVYAIGRMQIIYFSQYIQL